MPLDDLVFRHRPADADPAGALVLLHGRGVDENDLHPLLDVVDPEGRLEGFTPRAPLRLEGQSGNHWYVVERIGAPHEESFLSTCQVLGEWLDEVARETGIPPERTILGGFSQGGVMSYALGLAAGRPLPAAILALSCFVPRVEGWDLEPDARPGLPVYHSHGEADPLIGIEYGRAARDLLEPAVSLTYREHPGGHTMDPGSFGEIAAFVGAALPAD